MLATLAGTRGPGNELGPAAGAVGGGGSVTASGRRARAARGRRKGMQAQHPPALPETRGFAEASPWRAVQSRPWPAGPVRSSHLARHGDGRSLATHVPDDTLTMGPTSSESASPNPRRGEPFTSLAPRVSFLLATRRASLRRRRRRPRTLPQRSRAGSARKAPSASGPSAKAPAAAPNELELERAQGARQARAGAGLRQRPALELGADRHPGAATPCPERPTRTRGKTFAVRRAGSGAR